MLLYIQFVKSLVLSHFLYYDVIFSQTFCEVTDQLNKALNSCARYIFQPPPRQSMSDLSRQILTIDLEKYYNLRKCMTIYRLIHIQEPAYLADRLPTVWQVAAFAKSNNTAAQHNSKS
jgi:hypothetical protein